MSAALHGDKVKKKIRPSFIHVRRTLEVDVNKSLDAQFKTKGYRPKYSPGAIVTYAK